MRNLWLKLHLYAGLICFPYFIIFGISSLHINHAFSFMEPAQQATLWQKQLRIPNIHDDQQLADQIRDSLGLMGWAPWWEQERGPDVYTFMVTHAGTEYRVKAFLQQNKVEVEEKRKGFWPVLNSLHFLGEEIPGAPLLINSWKFYQDFSVVVMLFSIVSGVYIFLNRTKERLFGLILLGSCLGISFLYMLYVWLGE